MVFISGLFLFDFRIEFQAPIQPPLLVACPVLHVLDRIFKRAAEHGILESSGRQEV